MSEVLVEKHKSPKVSETEMQKRIRAECMRWYAHLFKKCGYCGGAHHKDYVCHCGFQIKYNDNNEEVWSDQ